MVPISRFDAAPRAFNAAILSSAACVCSPERCNEAKASKERSTAAEDGVLFTTAMRRSILPIIFGSWPKVARELDALEWTAIPVSFMGEIP